MRRAELQWRKSQQYVPDFEIIAFKNGMKYLMERRGTYYWRVIDLSIWSILLLVQCFLMLWTITYSVPSSPDSKVPSIIVISWIMRIGLDSIVIYGICNYHKCLNVFGTIWAMINMILSFIWALLWWSEVWDIFGWYIGSVTVILGFVKMISQSMFTSKVPYS